MVLENIIPGGRWCGGSQKPKFVKLRKGTLYEPKWDFGVEGRVWSKKTHSGGDIDFF